MNKILLVLLVSMVLPITGCAIFETETLKHKVDVLEKKVAALEDEEDMTASGAIGKAESITYVSDTAAKKAKKASGTRVSLSKQDIQKALSNAVYYFGPIDGKIGSKSKKAIKEFQADHGLKVDGVAGQKTQKSLMDYLTK